MAWRQTCELVCNKSNNDDDDDDDDDDNDDNDDNNDDDDDGNNSNSNNNEKRRKEKKKVGTKTHTPVETAWARQNHHRLRWQHGAQKPRPGRTCSA